MLAASAGLNDAVRVGLLWMRCVGQAGESHYSGGLEALDE
jgi:hypothetical protein